MKRVLLLSVAFCAWFSGICSAQDSIAVTDVEEIHIVNPAGVTQGVPSPNNGSAKMFAIAGFKC